MRPDETKARDRRHYVNALIKEKDMTTSEVFDVFIKKKLEPGVNIDLIRHAIMLMKAKVVNGILVKPGTAHVCKWNELHYSRCGIERVSYIAVYRYGPGKDVPRPKESNAQKMARDRSYYTSRKQVEGLDDDDLLPVRRCGAEVLVKRDPFALPSEFFARSA